MLPFTYSLLGCESWDSVWFLDLNTRPNVLLYLKGFCRINTFLHFQYLKKSCFAFFRHTFKIAFTYLCVLRLYEQCFVLVEMKRSCLL